MPKKKVISHLKGDIKTFKKEAKEDRELIKALKHEKGESKKKEKKEHKKKRPAIKNTKKLEKVMHEFKMGDLHSGSKMGPLVTNPKQAIAIGYSEARRAAKKKKIKK